ncbi:coiled-coil domain-containing protein 40 [Onthophagus taurus]|uniref:coiled-coil domain-containing protein 40 n=1 Tax=Onthophagus taurus TaxID=166361 RepID=UPI0039BE5AF7
MASGSGDNGEKVEKVDKGENDDDSLDKSFDFFENQPPVVIKKYFVTKREDGDGDSQPGSPRDDEKDEETKKKEEEEAKKKAEEDDEAANAVLEPEHPLLQKFQLALKEHLLRQIEHLKNEAFEYEAGAKLKIGEKESLGTQAYEFQLGVIKQQKDIDEFVSDLENITEAREEMENELQESTKLFNEEKQREFEAEKTEIELRKEVESVHLLMNQMQEWETDIESELKTNQRIFDKTRKDKLKFAEEKRELDVLVYKLTTEIWKLEAELETILMQLRVKEAERETLAQNLAMSNTDIEATQAEHRCLIRGWHSVVIAIGARDKYYNQIYQELQTANEKLRSIITETEQLKKLCKTEMNINESLTMFKARLESDISACRHQVDVEESKRLALERAVMQVQAIVDQTERDLQKAAIENHVLTKQINATLHDIQKFDVKKHEIEEAIVTALQDQITNDKASKYMAKTLREVREKNRVLEISLSTTENKNAKILMDIESQKRFNAELESHLKELLVQQNEVEMKLNSVISQSEYLVNLTAKRERDVHVLNQKYEALMERAGNVERSPHELKINALEQHIAEVQEKNKELQRFWLREQSHVVFLSEQRQQQIHDSNLLRKQTMILEQRNLKVNDELDLYNKQEANMTRSIKKLQNQILNCTEQLGKKKSSKQFLDEANEMFQNDFTCRLKDFEMSIIKLESDIQDLQNDIQQLSTDLIDKNREALEWEKHWKMLVETKKNINDAKSAGGEVGMMRSEIHRMRVRYGQLKRAQDKLIHDLDHCISRRDAIVTNAEAREKKSKTGQSGIIIARKLDDAKNKLKQMQDDVENLEAQIERVSEEIKQAEEQIASLEVETESIVQKQADLKEQIEEEKTDKQMKLDLLALNQRKLKIYVELAKGRKPFLTYKTDSKIMEEYTKQKDINTRLQAVVQELLTEIPDHKHIFQRIMNNLKLSTII